MSCTQLDMMSCTHYCSLAGSWTWCPVYSCTWCPKHSWTWCPVRHDVLYILLQHGWQLDMMFCTQLDMMSCTHYCSSAGSWTWCPVMFTAALLVVGHDVLYTLLQCGWQLNMMSCIQLDMISCTQLDMMSCTHYCSLAGSWTWCPLHITAVWLVVGHDVLYILLQHGWQLDMMFCTQLDMMSCTHYCSSAGSLTWCPVHITAALLVVGHDVLYTLLQLCW